MRNIFWKTRGIGRSEVRGHHGLGLRGGEAGGGEYFFVDGDEETFAASQDGAVGVMDFGLMEELSVGSAVGSRGDGLDGDRRGLTARRAARDGDSRSSMWRVMARTLRGRLSLLMASSSRCGDDAAVDMAGRALMHAVELDVAGGGDGFGV